uniref:BZIP domain-containing protein n=1 Tax=Globisporangium ultimum (strain ATCC 200006 / CBS 805.95 / DAOM BR144) TaxID=431595 RepID=K3X529_GLOUD
MDLHGLPGSSSARLGPSHIDGDPLPGTSTLLPVAGPHAARRPKPILPRIVPYVADTAPTSSSSPGTSHAAVPAATRSGVSPVAALMAAITVSEHLDAQNLARSEASSFSTLLPASTSASIPPFSAVGPATAAALPSIVSVNVKKKKKRIRIKTDRRREQCRTNQERYRKKQRSEGVELEEHVTNLREQVRVLEQQRVGLQQGFDSSAIPYDVVLDFFRQFRHGLYGQEQVSQTLSAISRKHQLEFLHSVFRSNLEFGDFRGIDALVEQWRRYSTFHQDLTLELTNTVSFESVSLSNNQTHTICATGELALTITRATIQHVFPHLEPTHARIVKKLIGKRVTYNGVFEFEFDADHKVQRLDVSLDLVASLLGLLHNVRDVATVLEHARIDHNFYLCDSEPTQQSCAMHCMFANDGISSRASS